jgi:hypothetical protein
VLCHFTWTIPPALPLFFNFFSLMQVIHSVLEAVTAQDFSCQLLVHCVC